MVQTRSHRSVSPKAREKEAPMLPKENEVQAKLPLVQAKPSLVSEPTYQKAHIPKALREQVWIQYYGPIFHNKCPTRWCQNRVNVFDFQVGHNVPESKGGSTTIDNLVPICGRCNLSMSNTYTFDEWSQTFGSRKRTWIQFFCQCCFSPKKE